MCADLDSLQSALSEVTAQLNAIERLGKPDHNYAELDNLERDLESAIDEHKRTCRECSKY